MSKVSRIESTDFDDLTNFLSLDTSWATPDACKTNLTDSTDSTEFSGFTEFAIFTDMRQINVPDGVAGTAS